jgi:hypothetical protein
MKGLTHNLLLAGLLLTGLVVGPGCETTSGPAPLPSQAAYLDHLTASIQKEWLELFAGKSTPSCDQVGVSLVLRHNGTVGSTAITGCPEGDWPGLLGLLAIDHAAPFGQWPKEMEESVLAMNAPLSVAFDYGARKVTVTRLR